MIINKLPDNLVKDVVFKDDTFKKNVTYFFRNVSTMFHKVGFWILILLIVGGFLGGSAMSMYQKSQMNDAIMLGGFVYNGKVFDIKERIR